MGEVILFNRKPKKPASRQKEAAPLPSVVSPEIVEAVKSLGLNVTTDAVGAAIEKLFPTGIQGLDQGDVIRKLFLHLQGKKK